MSLQQHAATFPPELRELELWCPWALDHAGRKRPRGPHLNEHAYPVRWGQSALEEEGHPDPRTDFETCMRFVEHADDLSFPPDDPERELHPGLILPHDIDEREQVVMQVDLDDVRDPETGDIHPAAREIVSRARSYAALSSSGEGVHVIVFARLPHGRGKFIGELDDEPFGSLDSAPQVELYDHGRVAALTGDHLNMTPLRVADGQELVDDLIDEYGDDEPDAVDAQGGGSSGEIDLPAGGSGSSGGAKSDYYSKAVTDFAEPKHRGRDQSRTHGAHPAHGGTSSSDDKSMNYHVLDRHTWYCFACDFSGGPLNMASIMCHGGSGACCDRWGDLDALDDDEFLEACLYARDRLGFDGDPPYRAIRAVAEKLSLSLADPDSGKLGKSAYRTARDMYDRMSY